MVVQLSERISEGVSEVLRVLLPNKWYTDRLLSEIRCTLLAIPDQFLGKFFSYWMVTCVQGVDVTVQTRLSRPRASFRSQASFPQTSFRHRHHLVRVFRKRVARKLPLW